MENLPMHNSFLYSLSYLILVEYYFPSIRMCGSSFISQIHRKWIVFYKISCIPTHYLQCIHIFLMVVFVSFRKSFSEWLDHVSSLMTKTSTSKNFPHSFCIRIVFAKASFIAVSGTSHVYRKIVSVQRQVHPPAISSVSLLFSSNSSSCMYCVPT